MRAIRETRQVCTFPESLLISIWQDQIRDRTDLVTEEGEPITVIYPGRLNRDQGADLLDAVIATSQGVKKGDIEVHVKSSSWRAHRHHHDPAYNRVILQVVFWHDSGEAAALQSGSRIPTLAVHKYLPHPAGACAYPTHRPTNALLPCKLTSERRDTSRLTAFMDRAGSHRFLAKAAAFQADLARTEVAQSLYQGIMAALGYTKNKDPFSELARRLPLSTLESTISPGVSKSECLARQQALLLGTAGLLPSQCLNWQPGKHEQWINKLEEMWTSVPRAGAMSENDWHFTRVRPSNYPARRIAAMSYLVYRFRGKGLLTEVIHPLKETTVTGGKQALESIFLVTADGYWANHVDTIMPSRQRIPTLIGSARAADIVVNVLLPFTFAWSQLTRQPDLARKSVELYQGYPRLAVNVVERHMCHQLRLSGDLVNSARRQQGLIHIYKTLCSQGQCHCCPLNPGRNQL